MNNHALPFPLNQKFGHLKFVKQRTATEYSAECPVCSDSGHVGKDWPDRFRMFNDDKPLGWCRRCGHVEFADDPQSTIDPVKIKEFEQRRRELADQEQARLSSKIQWLQKEAVWKVYHDQMKEGHRALWRQAGIPEDWQDFWQLGYADYQGNGFVSPSLSIPYFAPDWQAQTIQYRLTNPPEPSDKYRFQAGLKAGAWLADPTEKPSGAALLMEGMKKAAVTFINTTASGNGRFSVVAVPSKTPGADMLDILADCDPVYICLDPDAYQPTKSRDGKMIPAAVNRLVELVGRERARLVRLPDKADDLFVEYGYTARVFNSFVNQAMKAA